MDPDLFIFFHKDPDQEREEKIKSAFILPHLGSATKDTRIAMANLAIDNIDEFFNTGNCKNKVN